MPRLARLSLTGFEGRSTFDANCNVDGEGVW